MKIKKSVIKKLKAGTHQVFLNGSDEQIEAFSELIGWKCHRLHFVGHKPSFETMSCIYDDRQVINLKDCFEVKKPIKIKKSQVIHCETEEEANAVLKIAHEQGYRWYSGKSFVEINCYDVYFKDTCYEIEQGMYSPKSYYKDFDEYKIIPAKKFLKSYGIELEKEVVLPDQYYVSCAGIVCEIFEMLSKIWDGKFTVSKEDYLIYRNGEYEVIYNYDPRNWGLKKLSLNNWLKNVYEPWKTEQEKETFPFWAKGENNDSIYFVHGYGVDEDCFDCTCVKSDNKLFLGKRSDTIMKKVLTKIPNPFK